MMLLTDYRNSKHGSRPHLTPFVGPRTYRKARRRWQVRILIDLPFEPGATERTVETITLDTSVMRYEQAAIFARAKLASALIEYDDWTDFAYQVWVP